MRKKGGEFIMNYRKRDNMKPFLPKEARILDVGCGPVVPCRIYHGSKEIGMISYDKENRTKYRIDSDALKLHQVLEKTYLEALHEARDVLIGELLCIREKG